MNEIEIKMENTKVIINKDGLSIEFEKNYTLADLRQNLVNELSNNIKNLSEYSNEIDLLKVILDYEKNYKKD